MIRGYAKKVALGGVLAGVSVVIMALGGMIPFSTYACPMLSICVCAIVLRICGSAIAWAWYFAVSILCLMLGPDKEAAALFLIMGYYPILQPLLENCRLAWLVKLLYFNLVLLLLYSALFWLIGWPELQSEYQAVGQVGIVALVLLGNVTFFLLDLVLRRLRKRRIPGMSGKTKG